MTSAMTVSEAAEWLNTSQAVIREYIKRGILVAHDLVGTITLIKEGEHYVRCRNCNKAYIQLSQHVPGCCGLTASEYRAHYPEATTASVLSSTARKKTPEQKQAQSEKLKTRFQTEAGQETRKQISEASKKMQASEYGQKAAEHLRALNQDPERRREISKQSQARWDSGEQRQAVEGWHRDNREASLASAAHARKTNPRKRTKLHLKTKAALEAAGLTDFITEHEVDYYSIDEGLPALKIALEIDGCYWHGCDKCGFPGVKGTQQYDRRKTTYLTKRGWTILRLVEHDIHADLGKCVARVQETVDSLRGAPCL